jgi:hypothetical protein
MATFFIYTIGMGTQNEMFDLSSPHPGNHARKDDYALDTESAPSPQCSYRDRAGMGVSNAERERTLKQVHEHS